MKKIVKIIVLSSFSIFAAFVIGFSVYFSVNYFKYSKLELDTSKLSSASLSIEVFDSANRPMKEDNMFGAHRVKSGELLPSTKQAFISIEDKDFYKHNGVNYKRIVKAMLNNIKSGKLSQGASTISQQLIKNTHLSSEKTFDRKIKEMALAKKLEKKYSKDEILEQYLNVIYFGNNCYGIENASNYYFSKPACQLNLAESATLAAIIKSPSKYCPINKSQNCINRRNLVLKEMEKDGVISSQQYMDALNTPLELNLSPKPINKTNSYSQAAIEEAKTLLGLPAKQIALRGYQLHTYQNLEKQDALERSFDDSIEDDHAAIVINNSKRAVEAYIGKSAYKIITAKRQPGSCIKPILIYGPALNEDIISPSTQLLDEKTTIAGYTPKNVGDKYLGYVSAREALAKSINIPAVKVLSYVGIDKAKSYAENLGITFDKQDDNYALALGGMAHGVTINELASAYCAIANGGTFSPCRFISYITDSNDKLIYVHRPEEKRVLRDDSAYLLTDMLRTSAKTGTARKLADLSCDIASKTGTVGKSGSKDNLDAWNMSYTKAQTVGVWIGNLNNDPTTAVGGGVATQVVKNYFLNYNDQSEFERPSSIVSMPIDTTELDENHKVVLANSFTPERWTRQELFSRFNVPSEISKKFTQLQDPEFKGKVFNDKAELTFTAKEYCLYEIYRNEIKADNLMQTISGKSGKQILTLPIQDTREKFYLVTKFTSNINNEQSLISSVDLIKSNAKQGTDLNQKYYL